MRLTIAFSTIVAALMIAAAATGIGMAWGARRREYQANKMVVLEGGAQLVFRLSRSHNSPYIGGMQESTRWNGLSTLQICCCYGK